MQAHMFQIFGIISFKSIMFTKFLSRCRLSYLLRWCSGLGIGLKLTLVSVLCLYGFLFRVSGSLCWLPKFKMVQSDLLKKKILERSLVAVAKKLRIKVPYFDNSALIKGY